MPFGCPDLIANPCLDENGKLTGVIWFCDRLGCICVCCREDFTGENEKYPEYCPPPEGFEPLDIDDEYYEEYWDDYEDW